MRRMKNKDYWASRQARQMYKRVQDSEDYLTNLASYYIASSAYMQTEAEKILKKFQLEHNLTRAEAERLLKTVKDPADIKELVKALKKDPKNAALAAELESQAYAARISRLASLHAQLAAVTAAIGLTESNGATRILTKIAKDVYLHKIFDLQQYANAAFDFKMMSEKDIKQVLDQSWAGSGFSQRIWGNTKKLEEAVKREITIGMMTGRSPHKTAQAIEDEFHKGYNNARRLIRTETTCVAGQMDKRAYKECGVGKYIYVATLDLRTSKICRSLDGKTFELSKAEVGKNYPPMHPYCRSTTIGWLPESWLKTMKRRARDPKTGKSMTVPANMTYQEWYDKYVKGRET